MEWLRRVLTLGAALALTVSAAAAMPGESKRLGRAKEFIAEERWARAIEELQLAVADPRESGRAEALYWLAHSQHQSRDSNGALQTIRRLETQFPASAWVQAARSLRIDIAVRLRRNDVLWWTAVPSPPPPGVQSAPTPPSPFRLRGAARGDAPAPPAPPRPADAAATVAPAPRPPAVWVPEGFKPDVNLRIQALGHLMRFDAEKVIPELRRIALEAENPSSASRAVFVLAASGRPEARATVVQVAKSGPEPVRVAAVRELARFGGPEITKELLQVYQVSALEVKRQVVKSLAEREDRPALFTIVSSETNADLRSRAARSLAVAGAWQQLRQFYEKASLEARRPIVVGLFDARADDELIQLAQLERDAGLRREILKHLQVLETPAAKEYLRNVRQHR